MKMKKRSAESDIEKERRLTKDKAKHKKHIDSQIKIGNKSL